MYFDPVFRFKVRTSRLRPQVKALYGWYKAIAFPKLRIAFEKRQLLESPGRFEPQDLELLKHVSVDISSRDGMHTGNVGRYFHVGLSAIQCIDRALARCTPQPDVKTILDMPSGYGRVLRFLAQRFPEARITACELDKAAVDYCAKHFGAQKAYSETNLRTLSLGTQFDLIWCGSLITHLDRGAVGDVLEFFHRHSAPGGVVIFTTHGTVAAQRIKVNPFGYSVPPEELPRLLSSFEQCGFSYVEYPWEGAGYGVSLSSRAFIEAEVTKFADWQPIYFGDHEWDGAQDVHAVVRKA
jgi:SAM-dependent methyltransferase